MKKIAFYLPQYHSIPENDEWWGKGFTEWTNVKKSKPQFNGHHQPEVPFKNNYYCLLDSKTQEKQSKLALKYGIDGFCYYHYWFEGKMLLEKPMEAMLHNPKIKIPFCICWANESWTRNWDGLDQNILIKQNYNEDETGWKKHFDYLLPFFKDSRYILDNGRPILVIYKPYLIKNCKEMIEFFRKLAKESGFVDLYIGYQYHDCFDYDMQNFGLDFGIEFEPFYTMHEKYLANKSYENLLFNYKDLEIEEYPFIYDYDKIWENILKRKPLNNNIYPGAFPSWDNTPRKGKKATVFWKASPEKFKNYFEKQLAHAQNDYHANYIFINAWNEWGEGAHLEPDKRNKFGYLKAIKPSKNKRDKIDSIIKKILYRVNKKYLLKHTKFFDEEYYSETYNIPFKKVYKHYLNIGDKEGYNASPYFNSNTYRKLYNDIPKDMNALLHYVVFGQYEGRKTMLDTSESEKKIESDKLSIETKNNDIVIPLNHEINDINLENLFCLLEYENASIFNKPQKFIDNKYCLIYSHDLNFNGAPIALFNMVLTIRDMGITPIVICKDYGKLINYFKQENIIVIVYKNLVESILIEKFWHLFDFIVLNTLVFSDVCAKLNGTKNSVVWWIHESKVFYDSLKYKVNLLPKKLCDNIHIYAVGDYAKEKLKEIRPKYKVDNLMYCISDSNASSINTTFDFKKNKLYTFATVGTLEPRKGYDILLKSFEYIDEKFKDKIQIVIVGKKYIEDIYNDIISNKVLKIYYIESIDKDKMIDFYHNIDCLICPSIDDPMPIVITEAWKYKIPVIMSENTGSARLVKKYGGGLVYESNDPKKLAIEINNILSNNIDLNKLIGEGYYIYSNFFTKGIFDENVKNIINNLNNKEKIITSDLVSVVIPTYNGLNDIKTLISSLQKQKNVNLEIVVVDSGSTDGTVEYLRENNVELITIPNNQFSHSGARNLGASKASGKYLLFMTQDANITNEEFVCEFLQPILKGEAVACICRQTPRKDADLYARFCVYQFNEFVGLYKDLITEYSSKYDKVTERQMAQLNDVCCIIDKGIFDKYKYSGEFAEDLELGRRLIKDGYNLYHMSNLEIIHSHTRNSFYFFCRSYVDQNFFSNIKMYDEELIDKVLTIYILFLSLEADMPNIFENSFDWKSLQINLVNLFNKRSEEMKKNNYDELIYTSNSINDDLKRCMISIYEYRNKKLNYNFDCLYSFAEVAIEKFIDYCKHNECYENINKANYYEYLEKAYAAFAGTFLTPVINYFKYLVSDTIDLNLVKI